VSGGPRGAKTPDIRRKEADRPINKATPETATINFPQKHIFVATTVITHPIRRPDIKLRFDDLGDSFADLERWHRFSDLLDTVAFVVRRLTTRSLDRTFEIEC
jgi:hypothetical protein